MTKIRVVSVIIQARTEMFQHHSAHNVPFCNGIQSAAVLSRLLRPARFSKTYMNWLRFPFKTCPVEKSEAIYMAHILHELIA